MIELGLCAVWQRAGRARRGGVGRGPAKRLGGCVATVRACCAGRSARVLLYGVGAAAGQEAACTVRRHVEKQLLQTAASW